MLLHALRSLLKTTNNNAKIYVHNLSKFDGVFLLRILSDILNTKLSPIIKNGKMINLNLSWKSNNPDFCSHKQAPEPMLNAGVQAPVATLLEKREQSTQKGGKRKYSIDFRDSLLLLPVSLRKLAQAFDVELKSFFPFSFLNKPDTNLLYEGIIPTYESYPDISITEYNNICKKVHNKWNLKSELIKYCEQDCKSLWLIISNFNSMIYKRYKLNVHRFPTLPSLTMGIWLCHYLQDSKVPILIGPIFDNIKTSYTGGHTDVYKPNCNNVFAYDVNSLYPHVMEKFDMPIGRPKYFEGDIFKYFPNAIGFFECEITTPLNMYRPLLQTKVTTRNGVRTIAPVGK